MDGQPKKFRFTLTALSQIIQLLNAPQNWEKTVIEFKRSPTYQGVIRSLTLPFSFVYKGAGIVRNIFYTKGILGVVTILIEKLNPLNWQYVSIFNGKVDMTTIVDDKSKITASIIENSFAQNINAYDGVKYQIPIDISTTGLDIQLTPLPFKEKATFLFAPTSDFRSDTFFETKIITNDQHSTQNSVQDVGFFAIVDPDYSTDNHWFYYCRNTCNLVVKIQLNANIVAVDLPNTDDRRFQIQFVKSTGEIVNILYDQLVHIGTTVNIDTSISIQMNTDEKLFIYFKNVTDNHTNSGFKILDGTMSLSYLTQTPQSLATGVYAYDVFDELIQLMNGKGTGGTYVRQPIQSVLLQTTLRNLSITCSNSIRKVVDGTQYNPGDSLQPASKYLVINGAIVYNSITYDVNEEFIAIPDIDTFTTSDDGSVILIQLAEYLLLSFKDFFQSIYSVMGGNCIFGVDNGTAVLEKLDYGFRNLTMLDLGTNFNDLKISPALDYVYNSIKVGYDDQQYDSENGSQEVNSGQTYTGDLLNPQKELNLISVIRADPFGIESLRTQPQDTAASRSDNDNYFVWLNDEPIDPVLRIYKPLRGEKLISISGIDAGLSYYNWMLTPKRNLLRGAPFLASVFHNQTNLRFTSAFKNVNLVTVDTDGNRVAERDSLFVSDLGNPVFIPMSFDFNCKLQQDALNSLNIMYGTVAFTFRNSVLNGFIIESSVDAGQNSQRDFKLLSSPTNNFNNLIH